MAATFARNQSAAAMTRADLQERMVFLMINEAVLCLQEQIVAAPEDVDFAMVMGTGFAPFRGGPLRYADSLGVEKIVGAMEILADGGEPQFKPGIWLRRMAATGTKFYSKP